MWLDADAPADMHTISAVEGKETSDARWIGGTLSLVRTIRADPSRGQLALIDTSTTVERRITDDAGDKTKPYGWIAPEADGGLRVLALADTQTLVVYQDRGGAFWERVAQVEIPTGSGGVSLGSPEPFVAGGRSYASLAVKTNASKAPGVGDAQIWIVDLGDGPRRRAPWRCDDGAAAPVMRIDPETYRGSEQTFVYYYVFRAGGGFTLYRCATGLRTGEPS